MEGDKVKNVLETSLGVSVALTPTLVALNPEFGALPIIANVINEVFAGFSRNSTEKRLQKLQTAVDQMGIQIEVLRENLNRLNEHDQYVLWNDLKFLCTEALPEVTDPLIDNIIAFIMEEDNREMNEELCEILRECNATDIQLLYFLKGIRENNDQEDVSWEEFVRQMDLSDKVSASDIINNPEFLEVVVGETKCPYLVRALLKMQRLGAVEIEQFTTLGSINTNNIKGIHITVFGTKLMGHLKLAD